MLKIKQVHHTLFFFSLPLATIAILAPITIATAQEVSTDGTVSTTVTSPDGKNFTINDGTTRGTNLFHSFKEFSVPTGGSANFNNAANIQNIISRVTGGSKSTIDGLIKANGGANLFLLNPAGILFGPNARLNIGGSFLGSTANSFIFENGFEFSATNLQAPPLLTINLPIGLRYGDNPGEIQVQGRGHNINFKDDIKKDDKIRSVPINNSIPGLELESGKTLALVGGKVSLEGAILNSSSGRIEIGSVASNGTVSLVPVQEGWKLGYESIGSFEDIKFSRRTLLDTKGDGGGSIAVAGKNINFTGESILLADTLGDRNGGEISIVGDKISVNESEIRSFTFGSGNAGKVKLVANKSILLENYGGAGTNTVGLGKAGEITVQADSIEVRDRSGLGSHSYGKGNAGRMEVQANSLLIENQSGFGTSSNAEGNAGEINIVVSDFVLRNQSGLTVNARRAGNGGKINITANSLRIEDKTGVNSYTEENSTGQGGEVNLNVAGPLVIQNEAGINSDTKGTGNAGKISIKANSLQISDSSGFTSTAEPGSTGNAGKIDITANSLQIANAGFTSDTKQGSTGLGGEINVNVAGPVELKDGAYISNSTSGTGNAGKTSINANSLQISNDSGFSSEAKQGSTGQGGEINFNVTGRVEIKDGAYISNSTSGIGNAGKTSINANSLQISNDSGFSSEAKQGSTGQGGEINFNVTGSLVLKDEAYISNSTSGIGNAGKTSINANSLQISNGSGFSSQTKQGSTGLAGEINFNVADSVVLQKNSYINNSTSGTDNAGKIIMRANSLLISDGGGINSSTQKGSTGQGGEINLNVEGPVVVRNRVGIDSNTSGRGNAGKISITANSLEISDRSGVTSTARSGSTGQAGEIIVNIRGPLVLQNAGINSNTDSTGNAGQVTVSAKSLEISDSGAISTSTTSSGNAGNLNVEAKTITLNNDGKLRVSSTGNGNAGTLNVAANTIRLNNQSSIDATTNSGNDGGNLTLDVAKLLLLRGGSSISATAGTKDAPGDGGNITINAPKGVIVAFPTENSDITANSFSGSGGKITIKTQGLFGIAPLSRQELERRLNTTDFTLLDPKNLPTSDITAISQQNPSFSGAVNINTQLTDPSRGLFELSETVIDPAQQIAQNPCLRGGGEFIITGRGGFPTDPSKGFSSDNARVDLVKPVASKTSNTPTSTSKQQSSTNATDKPIVPARGWIFNEKGEVVLVAYDPTKTGVQRSSPTPASSCAAR